MEKGGKYKLLGFMSFLWPLKLVQLMLEDMARRLCNN